MTITEIRNKRTHKVVIEALTKEDYKQIPKSRYYFDWSKEKKHEVFKLTIKGDKEILGLISIERIPDEWRIHIRLLTVSKENSGSKKAYAGIAANLITFVSKIALREYAELACVSLKPKGALVEHYRQKYSMNVTGATLSLEILEIMKLINTYDHA